MTNVEVSGFNRVFVKMQAEQAQLKSSHEKHKQTCKAVLE